MFFLQTARRVFVLTEACRRCSYICGPDFLPSAPMFEKKKSAKLLLLLLPSQKKNGAPWS